MPRRFQVDDLVMIMFALFAVSMGLMMIGCALEGAEISPRIMLREGVLYTARTAVTILLIGQAFLAAGIYAVYGTWKHFTRIEA